jgi:hypothetical protein
MKENPLFLAFRGLFPRKEEPASGEIEEIVLGRPLTVELFKEELSGLGYDFEVFAANDGKIWRFRRIPPRNERENGDVW